MGHLQRLHERFANEGLLVYTIAVHENAEEARRMTVERGITYPVFVGTRSELAKRYAYG